MYQADYLFALLILSVWLSLFQSYLMISASEEVQDRENIFSLVQECVDINCDDSITIAGELWAGQRGNNHRLIDN